MIRIQGEFRPIQELLALTGKEHLTKLEKRILAQLKFVCSLSEKNSGCYDNLIGRVQTFLTGQYHSCGCLTKDAVSAAEEMLSPAAQEAKTYRFLCVAHAHIDMNWMWGYDETVGTTIDTFRTMLDLMREYPGFKFSQSQASVYRIMEEHDPAMLEEIKQRVLEKRWEITASTWVETDKNMPSGESLSRHILYTKSYLSQLFGLNPKDLEIDFEPDTFGHSRNIPEILAGGGIKYYYHCRGQVGEDILYRWKAPSGADVILYTEPFWYNSGIDEHIADYATELERITNSKTLLKVYGVGNHGGGPTRRDIEALIDMNSWPVFPSFQFSFLKDYFKSIEAQKARLPVIDDEINFLCDGCYTTQSRIKEGNRKSERLLQESETFHVLSDVYTKGHSPIRLYRGAWEKVLFNQFHDILPGSGVTQTREYASGLYQQVFAAAETAKKTALRRICDRIDTSRLITSQPTADSLGAGGGPGFGFCGRGMGPQRAFVLFNHECYDRTETAELILWDYEGDLDAITVKNSRGEDVLFQTLERKQNYWDHEYTRLLIEADVPALGYAVYTVVPSSDAGRKTSFINDMRVQTPDEFILENELLKVRLNSLDGSLASVIYKPTGRELVDPTRPSGIFRYVREAGPKGVTSWNETMSAWFTGRYNRIESAHQHVQIKTVWNGPLRTQVRLEASFGASRLTADIFLDKGSSNLCYSLDCDWREFGSADEIPALNFYLPSAIPCAEYQFDIPFGVITRQGRNMDLPGNSFACAVTKPERLMLITKTKYGFRCHEDSLSVTLLRSACHPDPTPEIGMHHIEFAIAVMDEERDNRQLLYHSSCYNHPLSAVSTPAHPGTLPAVGRLMSIENGTVCVSSIKAPEDGSSSILVRLYEADGLSGEVRFSFDFEPQKAVFVDLLERETANEQEILISNRHISFSIGANQVKTLKIYYQNK